MFNLRVRHLLYADFKGALVVHGFHGGCNCRHFGCRRVRISSRARFSMVNCGSSTVISTTSLEGAVVEDVIGGVHLGLRGEMRAKGMIGLLYRGLRGCVGGGCYSLDEGNTVLGMSD